MRPEAIETARRFLGSGRLTEAAALVRMAHPSDLGAALVLARVELELGHTGAARRLAETVLKSSSISDRVKAEAEFVFGTATWELGDERGRQHLLSAAQLAEQIEDTPLSALARLQILERDDDLLAPHVGATTPDAVRAVLRVGSHETLLHAHLAFARLEARAGRFTACTRHLVQCYRTLRQQPNPQIEASCRLTEANLLSVQGEPESAREVATEALRMARQCGWDKGLAIASGSLAVFCLSCGDTQAAEEMLSIAEGVGYEAPNFLYAVLDTRALVALAKGELVLAEAVCDQAQALAGQVGAWYRLRCAFTRTRILEAQGLFSNARSFAQRQLVDAERVGNRYFVDLFTLKVAELTGEREATQTHIRALELQRTDQSLAVIGARLLVQAKVLASEDGPRSQSLMLSAQRTLRAAGAELEWEFNKVSGVGSDDPPTLDHASALLDVGGYPHVLAREVFALVRSAAVASSAALVASKGAAVRVIVTAGWSEAEARAAAVDQDMFGIECGCHRDEIWKIVADLNQNVAAHCTAVALRDIVTTAVILDRYRREEKQRSALWPADSIETEGGLFLAEQTAELLSLARRIAATDISVLVTGETGTGKEVLARAIHRASPRSAKHFVPFNCTAVARDMLESQLFGYRRGAFTGAHAAFEGIVRGANGGTLFLDEIAEIGLDLQPKLLRFLETHEVHPLGEAQPVKVDVRVIAATNADLEQLVALGRFREDLFYRLNIVKLKVPPLRERREEIRPLIDYYLRKSAEELKKGHLTVDDDTLEYLLLYAWPGNVRQLVNEIRRVVAFAELDGVITPALLSPEIQASRRTVRVTDGEEPEVRVRLDQPMNEAIDTIEQAMVRRALQRAQGNYENAARLLGISRKGLFLKRRRWGMQRAS